MPSGRAVSRFSLARRSTREHAAWLTRVALTAACLFVATPPVASLALQDAPAAGAGAAKSSPAAIRQYNAAAALHNKKLYDLAADEWAAFVKDYPEDGRVPDALMYLGVCKRAAKDYAGAVAAYRQLVKDYPKFDKADYALYQLADSQLAAGKGGDKAQFAAALETCKKLAALGAASKYAPNSLYLEGEVYYAQGKQAEAAAAYARLVKDFPKNELADDALYAQGVALEEGGKGDEAEKKYAEFVRAYPTSSLASEVKYRRAELLYAKADYATASPLFVAASGDAEFKLAGFASQRAADCLFQQKQYPQAAAAYEKFIAANPSSEHRNRAQLALGRSWFAQNEFAKARAGLEPLVAESDPLSLEAAHWIAQSYLKERKPKEAVAAADRGLAQPNAASLAGLAQLKFDRADALFETPETRPEALKQYAEIARRHAGDPLAPDAEYLTAFTALDLGELDQAVEYGQAFLKAHKSHRLEPDVRYIVAEGLLRSKQYAAADKAYAELTEKFPDHALTQKVPLRQATALYLEAKYDDAIASLKTVLASKPGPATAAEAQHMLGRCYSEKKDWANAARALNAALAAKSDWRLGDETLLLLGHVHEQSGDATAALADWKKLLDGFPQSNLRGTALFRTAEARYGKSDFAAAAKAYQTLLETLPDDPLAPAARHGLALSRLGEGQFDAASKELDALLASKPSPELAKQARYARGLTLRRQKKWQEAAADLQAFLKQDATPKERSDARYELALCQVGQNQWEEAVKTLRAIVVDDPNYPASDKVDYELGWALKSLGDEPGATKAFERLVDKKPDSPLAGEALFHVAEASYAAKDYAAAGEQYQAALAKSAGTEIAESAGHKLGWSLYFQDQFDAAQKAFAEQLKAFPSGKLAGDARFMEGECSLKQEKYAAALGHYESAIPKLAQASNAPLHQFALLHAAQAASKLSKPDFAKALKFCEEFLKGYHAELSTQDESIVLGDVYYEQGFALEKLGRTDDALAAYDRVTKHSGGESAARACFRRGEILFGKKEHKEAVRWYYKAAYSYPYPKWAAVSLYEAGRCFEVLKKTDEAKAAYAEVVEKYADSDQVGEAKARLQALGG